MARRKKRSGNNSGTGSGSGTPFLSMSCPPKTFCINKVTLAFVTIFAILAMLVYRSFFRHETNYYMRNNMSSSSHEQARTREDSNGTDSGLMGGNFFSSWELPSLHMPRFIGTGERDVYKDTYTPPLKPNWSLQDMNVDRYKMPINVSTSYKPRQYRQVGILTRADPRDNERERETILALFGRPIHASRSKWQYYTMTDKQAGIKLPISIKGRSANVSYGVDELFTNDMVHVKGYGDHFKVTIYDTEMLEYHA